MLEWLVQEPEDAQAYDSQEGEGHHPAAKLLLHLEQWAGLRGAGRTAEEEAAALFFASNLDNRWKRERDVPLPVPKPLAEAPRGDAQCVGAAQANTEDGIDPEVDAVLAEPGGGWRLLACLFLKLFHSHLAWLPGLDHKASLKQALYDPALLLLQWVARGDTSLAPTAAGLAVAVPRIAPFSAPANAGAWLPHDLPACFLPEQLAASAPTLRQARRLLRHRPGLARQIDAVQALALNVAALLNDLATERCLGLTAAQHAQRASHLHSGGKQWLNALKRGDEHALAQLRTSKDFTRDELLPRKALLLIMETWMAKRGCQFAREAAQDDALPLLPTPTQPAPARPTAGADA